MKKKVVVLHKINGLWQDMGLEYDPAPLSTKDFGNSREYKFSGPKRPLVRIVGSLYRIV